MSYLAELVVCLSAGVSRLPEELRRRHAAFLIDAENDDGGFAGRKGPSDPYYTSFALRALALLGRLDSSIAARVTRFLGDRLGHELPGVDFLSLVASAVLVESATGRDVFADWRIDPRRAVIDFLEPLRRDDGGYAKTRRGGQSSTYHTFLATACLQIVDAPLEEPDRIIALIRSRRRGDGGFVEIAPVQQSGANPTAAAIALLRMLDALDRPTAAAAAEFLAGMQTPQGGLRANSRIPAADLLTTFTGLVALRDLDALSTIDTAAARRFVESLTLPGGGFRAGTWDDAADVEYTFYGLGALGLLAH